MRVVIRADGDHEIGSGHVMRMLALADEVRARGGDVRMCAARLDASLAARVRARGVMLAQVAHAPGAPVDVQWTAALAKAATADWLVVDNYAFDAGSLPALRASGARVLWVDDRGVAADSGADLVLDQNFSARASMYPARPQAVTRMLLGPRFALVRDEFLAAVPPPGAVVAPRARRILVTMGGSDPVDATALVIDALTRVGDPALEVRVLIGPSNPRGAELAAACRDPRIVFATATDDMPAHLTWAEMCVAAAGSTLYELCLFGVPSLLVILADNQVPVATAAHDAGVARNLGWHHALRAEQLARVIDVCTTDRSWREETARRGRATVDGRGRARVVDMMEGRGATSTSPPPARL
jgi:UDP-2,4-diacetamido-2,4,6-trideoxy-beta-L-altropyranose hydrolase